MDLREAIEAVRKRLADFFQGDGSDSGPLRLDIDVGDLHEQLQTHRSGLLLGVYDEALATERLEQAGALQAIRERVAAPVRVRIDPDEGILRVLRGDLPEGPEATLVHVRVCKTGISPRMRELGFPPGDHLTVDAILLQNPGAPFPPGGGPLPGQQWPGLGVGPRVLGVIEAVARRLRVHGVLGIPQYYHAAALYHRRMIFVDPVAEGRFQALRRDLAGLSLREAAHAVAGGRVRDATFDEPFSWSGTEMALPLAEVERAYFEHPRWSDAAARTLVGTRFRLVSA